MTKERQPTIRETGGGSLRSFRGCLLLCTQQHAPCRWFFASQRNRPCPRNTNGWIPSLHQISAWLPVQNFTDLCSTPSNLILFFNTFVLSDAAFTITNSGTNTATIIEEIVVAILPSQPSRYSRTSG